jgi:hypothetical protein
MRMKKCGKIEREKTQRKQNLEDRMNNNYSKN